MKKVTRMKETKDRASARAIDKNRLMPRTIRSIFGLCWVFTLSWARAEFQIQQESSSLRISDDDGLITEYRTDSRVPYLYPLSAPKGAMLNRHWPIDDSVPGEERDHPHHRCFWLSHGDVNGFDFWAWKGKKGEAKIVHQRFENLTKSNHSAGFTVILHWKANDQVLLTETRQYTITNHDARTRIVDLTSELEATNGDVTFGDSKEGFCAFRTDGSMRLVGPTAAGHIANSEGVRDADCWGKRARWTSFYGPNEANQPAVITLMDHPKNLRHPSWWHARDYGLLAANPFGINEFENKKQHGIGNYLLKKGETLQVRYRLILQNGEFNAAATENLWKEFRDGSR